MTLLASFEEIERQIDPDPIVTDPRAARKKKRILWFVLAAFLIQGAITAGAVYQVIESRTWDPLGDYPEQQADAEVIVPDGATTAIVHVTATKCANERVGVSGNSSWVSAIPPGLQVPVTATGGAAIREKGCTTFQYENIVPPEVIVQTRQLGGEVTWRITGVELPIASDRTGVPSVWRTTPIHIVALGDNPADCPLAGHRGC